MIMHQLTDKVTLRHGATLNDRIVMAPMVSGAGTPNGEVTQEQLDYYARRSQVAGMIIVESCYVDPEGVCFVNQLGISNDHYIPGLKKLAQTVKKDGAKAIIQIHHAGRQASVYYDRGGIPLAPSKMDYSFLDYPVREITKEQIRTVIREYGEAARRAIEAGFDGVEIHGANHYLLQEFFSAFSNHRTDEYGGSLTNRMKFVLDVVDEVKRVIKEYAPKDFILGIRLSPDEIHGKNVGFTYKENQELIKQLNKRELDYIHIAGNIVKGAEYVPDGTDKTIGQLYREVMDPKTKLILCGSVFSAKAAESAVKNADMVSLGREALIEPDFAKKLHEGHPEAIISEISPQILPDLKWTHTLYEMIIHGLGTTHYHVASSNDNDLTETSLEASKTAPHGYIPVLLPFPNIDSVREVDD